MRIYDVISAEKSAVSFGSWRDDKPTKREFPMSRRKGGGAFPLTRKWRWMTIEFCALECKFVIMVAYHKDLPEFRAVLAERLPHDTRTLARLEYHGAHPVPGWHMHAVCGDVSGLELGITKPRGQKRMPDAWSRHRRSEYVSGDDAVMHDNKALELAATQFGVPVTKDLWGEIQI